MTPAEIAEHFLSLSPSKQRKLIDLVIASEEAMQDALQTGQWGLYAQLVTMRSLAGLPPMVATQ